ncbi:MAG: PQQ-binding-like beta-propeller repeat protein [Phycisphaerae bacterium]
MSKLVQILKTTSFMLAASFLSTGCNATAKEWPQWGGPSRDFIVNAPKLADTWPDEGPPKIWTRELGKGYSAIAVTGDKLITMYRNEKDEDVVVAMNRGDGKTIWEHSYAAPTYEGQVLEFGHGPNGTPLVVGNKIYTIGFTGKMNCLELNTGKPIWSHDLVKDFDAKVHKFGYSNSPMLYEGNIVVAVGGEKYGLVGFDPTSGKPAWKGEPMDMSYASPIVINVDGQDQFVIMSSEEVIGVSTKGKKLWSHPCVNQYKNNATDPLWMNGNMLWVSTQLDGGTRCLKLTRSGDKTSVEEVWFNDKVKIFHWNAIPVGDHVYGSIGGRTTFLAAVDIKTGEVKWKERGYHKANCLYADNKLIFLDENGQLVMGTISPDAFKVLGNVQLTEKVSWTVPTLVGDTLYVRDNKNIMALNLGKS